MIAAFRGEEPLAELCVQVLEDPCRTLVVSDYVWLEVLPKPRFHKRADEIMFMETVLDAAENIEASPKVAKLALELASTYNLSTMDALHAAAAIVGRVDELVTIEKPTRPLCQILEINVVSLYLSPV